MGLYKKLDVWSIGDRLDEIIDYPYGAPSEERESIYWDYYEDQINELSNLAADVSNELNDLLYKLTYHMDLPWKNLEFYGEDGGSGAAWFNTAACMLSDVDMAVLLENEGSCWLDEVVEKEKRIRTLERLTKKQQMWLYTEVIGFITRYLELDAAFEVITGMIRELEHHQSAVRGRNGDVCLPESAYL